MDSMQYKKQFLTFNIDQVHYGIDISLVTEIIGMQQVTPIPNLPPYIKGIMNLRGKIIPLIDVRLRLYNRERDYDDRTCVIVITWEDEEIGLIVDCVYEVISTGSPEEILVMEDQLEPFISQIVKLQEMVYMIMDVKELITTEQ